jgi:hypothetical protein
VLRTTAFVDPKGVVGGFDDIGAGVVEEEDIDEGVVTIDTGT